LIGNDFGVVLRNGLPLGLGSLIALGQFKESPVPEISFLLLENDLFVLLEDSSKIELE
jgi:hypothetical protein